MSNRYSTENSRWVPLANGGKEYKASRLGGFERVRGREKVIIRAREREEQKNRSVQADSRGHVSHYHHPRRPRGR